MAFDKRLAQSSRKSYALIRQFAAYWKCDETGSSTHRPAGSALAARRDGAPEACRRNPGAHADGFVVAAADEAACRAIQETEIIRLSIEGQRQIAAAILNPPAPTAALKRAAKRYRELFAVA